MLERLLSYYGVTLPDEVLVLLDWAVVSLLLVGLFVVARWLFRLPFWNESAVAREARAQLYRAIDTLVVVLRGTLAGLDLEAQEEQVRAEAKRVYESLPDILYVGKLPVPVKLILTEEAFVQLSLMAWNEVERSQEELIQYFEHQYEIWKEERKNYIGRKATLVARVERIL